MNILFPLLFLMLLFTVSCGPVGSQGTLSERPQMILRVTYHEMDDTGVEVQKDGDIFVKMFPSTSPNTVNRIKTLVEEGFFDDMRFHRVEEDFVVQIGDANCKASLDNPDAIVPGTCGAGTGTPAKPPLPSEREHSKSRRFKRGSLAMALPLGTPPSASCADSAGIWYDVDQAATQFFICTGACNHLDDCFTVFGEMIGGFNYLPLIKQNIDGIKYAVYKS